MPMKFELLPDIDQDRRPGAVQVETGVPIARPCIGRPPTYPWANMAVGDSFFTGTDIRSHVYQINKHGRYGHFVARKRDEDGREGYRVWRDQ